MEAVSDEMVAAWEPVLRRLAYRFVGRNGAEHDDLVQEGRIDVWRAYRMGRHPSPQIILKRMAKWVEYLGRQIPTDYELILPLETSEDEVHRLT